MLLNCLHSTFWVMGVEQRTQCRYSQTGMETFVKMEFSKGGSVVWCRKNQPVTRALQIQSLALFLLLIQGGTRPFRVLLRGRKVHHVVFPENSTNDGDDGDVGGPSAKDVFSVVSPGAMLRVSCPPLAGTDRRQRRKVGVYESGRGGWLLADSISVPQYE